MNTFFLNAVKTLKIWECEENKPFAENYHIRYRKQFLNTVNTKASLLSIMPPMDKCFSFHELLLMMQSPYKTVWRTLITSCYNNLTDSWSLSNGVFVIKCVNSFWTRGKETFFIIILKFVFNLRRSDTIKTSRGNFFKFSWVVHYRKICKN